jgi:hypothetical protein
MNIRQRVASGFITALCLGILLGAKLMPAQAGDDAVVLVSGKSFSSRGVQPGVPLAGQALNSPPMAIDRSTPMSVRPFAKPFIDRGPSMSERPLAPIGGGTQVAPGSAPLVWCQGQWVRLDNPWHSCPSR